MTQQEKEHTDAVWKDQYNRMVWIEASLLAQRETLLEIAPSLAPAAKAIIDGYPARFDKFAKHLNPLWQNAFAPKT